MRLSKLITDKIVGFLEYNTMRELNVNEVEQVNGGILPFIAAVVGLDAALIGLMVSMSAK